MGCELKLKKDSSDQEANGYQRKKGWWTAGKESENA